MTLSITATSYDKQLLKLIDTNFKALRHGGNGMC